MTIKKFLSSLIVVFSLSGVGTAAMNSANDLDNNPKKILSTIQTLLRQKVQRRY